MNPVRALEQLEDAVEVILGEICDARVPGDKTLVINEELDRMLVSLATLRKHVEWSIEVAGSVHRLMRLMDGVEHLLVLDPHLPQNRRAVMLREE